MPQAAALVLMSSEQVFSRASKHAPPASRADTGGERAML